MGPVSRTINFALWTAMFITIVYFYVRSGPLNLPYSKNFHQYFFLPIQWKPLEVWIDFGLSSGKFSFQWNPVDSQGNYILTKTYSNFTPETEREDFGLGKSVWIIRDDYEYYDYNRVPKRSLFWQPTKPGLEDPEFFTCGGNESFCLLGLDRHFQGLALWAKIPLIREVVSQRFPNWSPYSTDFTYVSMYHLPDKKRLVLSNPCLDRKIKASMLIGSENPLQVEVAVLCEGGERYQGSVDLKQILSIQPTKE